jgi:peptidyl-prolyl cis-trans isomerase B (cyclophilin B)
MLRLVACAASLSLLIVGCGGGGKPEQKAGSIAKTTATKGNKQCERAARPRPRRIRKQRPPSFRLSLGKTYTATVVTSCGSFTIKLDPKQAPRTGGSFVTLARKGFYDGLSFHRIVTGFVIQGGDPRGSGTGGPGYTIRERPPKDIAYSEGVVAMAKTGVEPAGTSGSQFFVVTSDDAGLQPDYALLGRVTIGLDVVHRIELVPAGPDGQPVSPVLIKRVKIAVR